jgi:phospholipase/lecithinase/hemolysin
VGRIAFSWMVWLWVAQAAAPPSPAPPRPYTMLYVFGDSYSDTGAGYIDSNGPTAVAYLAKRLGIPFTYFGDKDSKGKGLNFAVSGARTGSGEGQRYPHGELLARGMRNQVDDFADLVKKGTVKFNPAQTMFFIAGGLNDRGLPEGSTRTNLEADIEVLYAAGARRFQVALLPEKIPAFATAGTQFNPELAKIPAEERALHPDIRIANSDWGGFFDEVIEHPAKYGISDTTNACAGRSLKNEDPSPCASPDTHFYYNAAHPSTAAHRAVGDMLYAEALKSAP